MGDAAAGDRLGLARATACPSCAGSPRMSTRSTRPTSCRRRTCCRSGRAARRPYLYSDAEIRALMAASCVIPTPHRAATMRALIGLLAVTGMRIGEAIRLDQGDIDHQRGVLTVVEGKFGKSRQLPVHPTTMAALRAYLRRSDRPPSGRADRRGVHVGGRDAVDLLQRAPRVQADRQTRRPARPLDGLPAPAARPPPHAFAVNTLLDAYRDDR